jgi:hypothetical protein
MRSRRIDPKECMMGAIAVTEYGAVPAVAEIPKPEPGPGQILIKLRAAGMNPMDLERVADAVTEGRIVAPPIARISLEDVPAALDPALRRPASGKR